MAAKTHSKKQMTVSQLITQHKLNKPHIAALIGMPIGTFKNKLYENLPAWHFTKDEEKKIIEVLKTLAADIDNIKLEAV